MSSNRPQMAKSLNIWQVYFDEVTRKSCKPEWNHYDNSDKLTEFFENSVILDLVDQGEHYKADYFGVFSHDVDQGINFREDGLNFTPQNLVTVVTKYGADVYAFQKRRKNANIVTQAERYHPGFVDMMTKALDFAGFKLPNRLDKIVLFNYMVCTADFWDNYVNDMLRPVMAFLNEYPPAYKDSGYALIGRPMTPEKEARFIKAFGQPHYPYHPFICERLASVYLQLNPDYSFKQIF